jgi:hypothetical protein
MATTSSVARRTTILLCLLSLLLVAAMSFARPAHAVTRTITGGETSLRVNISTFLKVINAGISASAIPPARLEFGATPTVFFPVRANGAADAQNSLVLAMHDGGLRLQNATLTLDTTNLTISCTSLTGCSLLGTANQVLPNQVATIESVQLVDDEAGTVTLTGIAIIPEATALALNTLFNTTAFQAGDQLGVITARLNYDVQPTPGAYARPQAASPLRVSLVPAYSACTVPNREHGPPLAHPSCNPPDPASSQLTVGTPDANGQPAQNVGNIRFKTRVGSPGTPGDQADVSITVNVSDVRQSDLSDYAGELQTAVDLRLTDRNNSPGPPIFPDDQTGTVQDQTFSVTVPCTASADPAVGSDCGVTTSADSVVPGLVVEGDRTIWQAGQVKVFDGGIDGDADTPDNTLFAVQGVFIP